MKTDRTNYKAEYPIPLYRQVACDDCKRILDSHAHMNLVCPICGKTLVCDDGQEFSEGDRVRAIHRNERGEIVTKGDRVWTIKTAGKSRWFLADQDTGEMGFRDANDYEIYLGTCLEKNGKLYAAN